MSTRKKPSTDRLFIPPEVDTVSLAEPGDLSRPEGEVGSAAPRLEVADVPMRLRRLGPDELVSRGDYVADARRGFEPWEGPGGFRADAFVKPIYRRDRSGSIATERLFETT